MKLLIHSLFLFAGLLFFTLQASAQEVFDEDEVYFNQVPSYADVRDMVFAPYCYRCHSAARGNRAGINLETYANVRLNLSKVYSAAIVRRIMPPRKPLPQSPYNLLKMWIEAGAPP